MKIYINSIQEARQDSRVIHASVIEPSLK